MSAAFWMYKFQRERAHKRAAVAVSVLLVLMLAFTAIRLTKSRIDRRLDEATRTGVLR